MQYVDRGTRMDGAVWRDPRSEEALEALGYERIGVLGVHGAPSIEAHARGDMHDDDLAWFLGDARRDDQVWWNGASGTFAEVSGWLDGQPVLTLRTDFADGSLARTQTRFLRMPRWRSRVEVAEAYQLSALDPSAGVWLELSGGDPEAVEAAHRALVARVGSERAVPPRGDGTMGAYIDGTRRLLHFKVARGMSAIVNAWLFQALGVGLGLLGLLLMLAAGEPWRTVGMLAFTVGVASVWVARARPAWLPRVWRPSLPAIGAETPLLDDP